MILTRPGKARHGAAWRGWARQGDDMNKEKQIQYQVVKGAHLSDEQAKQYGKRITWLTEKRGFVTPEIVVDDAKHSNSPLHDYFDWSDKKAAEKWRIEQAKYLIRVISVSIIDSSRPEARYFYSIKPTQEMHTDAKQVYVTLDAIVSDKEKRDQVIAYAWRELNGWMDRYKQYSEFSTLIGDIKKHSAEFDKLR